MRKITLLLILIFILDIVIVNAQLAKVYNEENLDFDRAYRDQYLKDYNYFSNIDYVKITGGYTTVMKVGNVNDNIKGVNINNEKKYAIHLLYCEQSYCAFRINGVPAAQMQRDSTFRLDDEYALKITNIVVDFCDTKAFCHLGAESYDIVDILIDGPYKPFCGNGICDSGENCEQDSCCSGKKVGLSYDKENCGMCGYRCDPGFECGDGRCIEQCPETDKCDLCKSKSVEKICDCNQECKSNSCFNGKCILSGNDLSDYPNFLIKDGELYITTVVGDKSSSSNVLAQTYTVSSLSSLGRDVNIKNKLSSEITDLNQNIISIGNPCVNEISARIMNNPKPCNKDFPRGKGRIKLYKNGDFFHLIVAGYTDLGTKKAAEILADYQNYKFQGNEYAFEFAGEEEVSIIEEKKIENTTKAQITEKEQTQKNVSKETANIKIKDKEEQKIIDKQKVPQKIVKINETKQEKNQTEKSDNIISKFISWFLSLLR
ncbi:MAG: hypothetical protein AABX33_00425 [Nanoarchaeota archaeon]